jgi:hypothetical protein
MPSKGSIFNGDNPTAKQLMQSMSEEDKPTAKQLMQSMSEEDKPTGNPSKCYLCLQEMNLQAIPAKAIYVCRR